MPSSRTRRPSSLLDKVGTLKISLTKMLTFSEWPTPEAVPMAATRHHDDHREVLVHVDRGDEEVVGIDVHQPLFKVTVVLAGFLPTQQFLQRQLLWEHNVPVTAGPWQLVAPDAGSEAGSSRTCRRLAGLNGATPLQPRACFCRRSVPTTEM